MIHDAFRPITPAPDRARAEALRGEIDAAEVDRFGEGARQALLSAADRLLAEARSRDLADCQDLLKHVRALLASLDPRALEPRRGLAGLFDGHGGRLKQFRKQFEACAQSLLDVADTLDDRAQAVARRLANLDGFANDLRGCILEAEAHAVAAADHAAHEAVEDDAPPSPLRRRLSALSGAAGAALRQLPLTRMSQNAQHQGPDALHASAEALRVWAADWKVRLGLDRRRPRRVRPGRADLLEGRSALEAVLDRTDAYLTAARARHSQIEARMAAAAAEARRIA